MSGAFLENLEGNRVRTQEGGESQEVGRSLRGFLDLGEAQVPGGGDGFVVALSLELSLLKERDSLSLKRLEVAFEIGVEWISLRKPRLAE